MMITEEATQSRSLQISDRCDACQAQAFVLVKMASGMLTFCGHHYIKNQKALNKQSYEIVDEREHINAKSESSN